jgi:hypothetical protein
VLNVDQPPSIPQRPMGSIPVVIRLVRPDGEEWWPRTANRWTDTHHKFRLGRMVAHRDRRHLPPHL